MSRASRYFIPVCLYPHTKYRTRAGVADLFEKYDLRHSPYLIVVADRLLVLDRLVTGRYWTIDSATIKARQDADQIAKLIKRVAHKFEAQASGRIVFWDEIGEAPGYVDFATRVKSEVLADKTIAAALEEFVDHRVARFGLGSSPSRERNYEMEYLLSEVCMSMYCTEMLGYSNEVWERPPAPEIPDPLRLIYAERPELVARVTGRPASRALTFLYDRDSGTSDPDPKSELALSAMIAARD